MATSLLIKQQLIDNKDWDALRQTDIYSDFKYRATNARQYTLNSEFFSEFVFSQKKRLGKDYEMERLIMNFIEFSYSYKLSQEDYEKLIKNIIQNLIVVDAGVDYYFSYALKKLNLPTMFYKALSNIKNYLLLYIEPPLQNLDLKNLKNLTLDEIKNNLLLCRVYITVKNQHYLLNYLNSWEEIIKFVDSFSTNNIELSYGKIIKDYTLEEYKKFKSFLKSSNIERANVNTIYEYFSFPGKNIADNDLNEIIKNVTSNELAVYIKNLSETQIKNNITSFRFDQLSDNRNVSFEILKLKVPDSNIDISRKRFFTEEEIIKNPRFFDPEVIGNHARLYITKETFRILNKTWNKRRRYNVILSSVENAVEKLREKDFNLTNINYLYSKASDEEKKSFINYLTKDDGESESEEINILKRLHNKYGK